MGSPRNCNSINELPPKSRSIIFLNKNYAYVIISEDDIDDYADIFNASKNEDGTIDFLLRYYNGGCSFNEALTTAINKMNKI